jgi:hypothetical protein
MPYRYTWISYAAQQQYPTDNEKKKNYATEYITSALAAKNISISTEDISVAIEAALKKIKTEAGEEW